MGKRYKLGSIKKKDHEKIKRMTVQELRKKFKEYSEDDTFPCSTITDEFFTIDSARDFDHEFLNLHLKNVFTKKDTEKEFNDEYMLKIISKEGFKALIEYYHKSLKEYYTDLFDDTEDPRAHLASKLLIWQSEYIKPYSLDPEQNVFNSDNMEFLIFQLAIYYREFDWDNKYLTLSAW